MKLNQKGVTLVELIVSFALVAVAIVYFYQTLYTVKNLYSKAQRETNEYVDVNYAYRIIDALYTKYGDRVCDNINTYNIVDDNTCSNSTDEDVFTKITFKIHDEDYVLYRYNNL